MTIDVQLQQDAQSAVDILDRAFHDDPVMNWMSAHPDFRRTFFRITLPAVLPDGLTYIDEQGRGVEFRSTRQRELPLVPGRSPLAW